MKVILATGGSGGHVFPAISVANELKKNGHEVMFLGALKRAEQKVKTRGFDLINLDAVGLSNDSFIRFAKSILYMGKSVVKSYQYLKYHRPDIVVGFGGYGAFAPVFAAVALRYPTIIHEQNVVPGKTNRFLSKLVDKIAVSFKESEKYFNKEKTILTGCPSHLEASGKSRQEIIKKFNLRKGLPVILIMGGSQGSHRINEECVSAIEPIKRDLDFQIIHITGKDDFNSIKERYDKFDITYYLTDFLDEISEAYAIADLVISRAGAVTVSEIISFGVPAILIPYSFADGHQKDNADILKDTHKVKVIEEDRLSVNELKDTIINLIKNQIADKGIHKVNTLCQSDASKRLSEQIKELVNES